MLDPQLFRDDDGSEYLYFTTWGIYDGFGCGVAKLAAPSNLPQLGEALEVTSAAESGAATSPQLGGMRGAASPSWGRLEGAGGPRAYFTTCWLRMRL